MRKIVSEEEKKIWAERYLKGETARSIAKDFPQYNENTISKHIRNMGISRGKGRVFELEQLKPLILQEYQDNKFVTCASLASKYNLNERTISEWLKQNNITIKQKQGYISKSNQNYFDVIDTPNKAYLLGFITADGAVIGKGDNATTCSIEVHQDDAEILNFAKAEINPEATITVCNYGNKHNKRVSFNGKQLCEALKQYGIVKNKSKIIETVPVDKIPKELLCYYFRGLIDGDGCVLKSGYLSIYSGSLKFIQSVQEILCNEINVSKLKIYQGTTYFVTWTSKSDRQKLYDYLYENKLNDTYYYERKYLRLKNSLYDNTEVNF